MTTISLNARLALDDGYSSDEVEAALIRITVPGDGQVIRLSTDPTTRLSIEPLEYGTRSTWLGSNPATEPFKFVLAGAQLPDDREEGEGEVRLAFDLVDPATIDLLRSFSGQATVDLAVVFAGTPNFVEYEVRDMVLANADFSGSQLVLTITANPMAEELFPAPRMTRDRFPGLFP